MTATWNNLPLLGEVSSPAELVATLRAAAHRDQLLAQAGMTLETRFRPVYRLHRRGRGGAAPLRPRRHTRRLIYRPRCMRRVVSIA